ncbi:MAG TPA: hypothetical protein VIK89_13465 [Cytophagaceae bacterium]
MEQANKDNRAKGNAESQDQPNQKKGVSANDAPDIVTPSPPQVMNPLDRKEQAEENVSDNAGIKNSSDKGAWENQGQKPFIPEPPGYEYLEEEDQNDPNPNSNPNYSYYPNVAYPTGANSDEENV